LNNTAVSSAEAGRGFSAMNDIATCERTKLTFVNISDLLTMRIIGRYLENWDAIPFAKDLTPATCLATDTVHFVPELFKTHQRISALHGTFITKTCTLYIAQIKFSNFKYF
jgi:hypothetical protein